MGNIEIIGIIDKKILEIESVKMLYNKLKEFQN